jgi:hypothetical protein
VRNLTDQRLIQLADQFLRAPLYTCSQLSQNSLLPPDKPGLYGWWFVDGALPNVPSQNCEVRNGRCLEYVGVADSSLHDRIMSRHFSGKASNSTLRTSLGLLLETTLNTVPMVARTRKPGGRPTTWNFGSAEPHLSNWMKTNASVSWIELDSPKMLETYLIAQADLPLNRDLNTRHSFYSTLGELRRSADERTAPDTIFQCAFCARTVRQNSWNRSPSGQHAPCRCALSRRHGWKIVL